MDAAAVRPDLDQKYRELQPGLLKHLRYANAALAEDIAADVWTEVAATLPRFSGDDRDFRAWVFTVARRRVIDSYRRTGRRRVEPLSNDEIEGHPSTTTAEDSAVDRISTLEAISAVHDVLPRYQAEVVLLRVVGGLGVKRVAGMTGLQPVNVRVIQHRALRRLARHFGADLRSA